MAGAKIKVLNQEFALRPVNFFRGEKLLVDKACRQAREQLVPPAWEAFNYQVIHGLQAKLPQVLEQMQGLPLGEGPRLVVVREADKIKGEDRDWDNLWHLLNAPPPGVIYIFAQAGQPDRRLKIFKELAKLAGDRGDFSFEPWEKETILEPFVEEEFAGRGKKIEPAARQILAEFFGGDLGVLVQEIDKITTYVGSRTQVTEADLIAASPRLRGDFALAEAVCRKDLPESLKIIDEQLSQGEHPNLLISQLASAVRGLLQAKIAQKNRWYGAEAGKKLGVNPGFLRHYEAASARFTAGQLRKMLIDLAEADISVKTGRLEGSVVLPAIVANFFAAG